MKIRGVDVIMLFPLLSKHTGQHKHGCTSDGLRGFPCTQRQRSRSRARTGWLTLPVGPGPLDYHCHKSQPGPGCDPALLSNLRADSLQMCVSVPQTYTKDKLWQVPRQPDRVGEVKGIMRSPYTMSDRQLCIQPAAQ